MVAIIQSCCVLLDVLIIPCLHDAHDGASVKFLVVVLLSVQQFSLEKRHLFLRSGYQELLLSDLCFEGLNLGDVFFAAGPMLIPVFFQEEQQNTKFRHERLRPHNTKYGIANYSNLGVFLYTSTKFSPTCLILNTTK